MKYHLYTNTRTGERIITRDDWVWKISAKGTKHWMKSEQFYVGTFMAGDIALDNGFECGGELTEAEVFAELL